MPWEIENKFDNEFNVALNGKALSFIFKNKDKFEEVLKEARREGISKKVRRNAEGKRNLKAGFDDQSVGSTCINVQVYNNNNTFFYKQCSILPIKFLLYL